MRAVEFVGDRIARGIPTEAFSFGPFTLPAVVLRARNGERYHIPVMGAGGEGRIDRVARAENVMLFVGPEEAEEERILVVIRYFDFRIPLYGICVDVWQEAESNLIPLPPCVSDGADVGFLGIHILSPSAYLVLGGWIDYSLTETLLVVPVRSRIYTFWGNPGAPWIVYNIGNDNKVMIYSGTQLPVLFSGKWGMPQL